MPRTVVLTLTGFLAGSLGFAGASMLASTLPDPSSGGTPSPQLALVLLGIAVAVAVAGFGVALTPRWGRGAARLVGWLLVLLGFGGLTYVLVVTLFVAGAFPAVLLTPNNLTAEIWLAFTGVTGISLIQQSRRSAVIGQANASWLSRSSPLLVGVLLGILIGALWYAVIHPLIPYECCLQL